MSPTEYIEEQVKFTSSGSGAKSLGDGNAPAHAKGARRHLQSRRGLAPFVFAERDFVDHVIDDLGVESALDDFLPAGIFDDISLEDGIQYIILGQRILVLLVRPQL